MTERQDGTAGPDRETGDDRLLDRIAPRDATTDGTARRAVETAAARARLAVEAAAADARRAVEAAGAEPTVDMTKPSTGPAAPGRADARPPDPGRAPGGQRPAGDGPAGRAVAYPGTRANPVPPGTGTGTGTGAGAGTRAGHGPASASGTGTTAGPGAPHDTPPGGSSSTGPTTGRPAGGTAGGHATIALWGGAGSGKSTLLGALGLAVNDPANGEWKVWPSNQRSAEFLEELQDRLARDLKFPEGTTEPSGLMQFKIVGTPAAPPVARPARWWQPRPAAAGPAPNIEFGVQLRDLPGGSYDPKSDQGKISINELVRDFTTLRSMVYVLDPTREWRVNAPGLGPQVVESDGKTDLRQSSVFFTGVLNRLLAAFEEQGLRDGVHLPHHLAVCVTKFDDPQVFDFATRHGLVKLNERTRQPVVEDGQRFFDLLCQEFSQGGLPVIRQKIGQFFAPERVRYFVSSAVGFRQADDGSPDFPNLGLIDSVNDELVLVGQPRPINVLEPFVFLDGAGRRREGTG